MRKKLKSGFVIFKMAVIEKIISMSFRECGDIIFNGIQALPTCH